MTHPSPLITDPQGRVLAVYRSLRDTRRAGPKNIMTWITRYPLPIIFREGWRSGKTPHSYSRSAWFESLCRGDSNPY
jgi:hypothetical protein